MEGLRTRLDAVELGPSSQSTSGHGALTLPPSTRGQGAIRCVRGGKHHVPLPRGAINFSGKTTVTVNKVCSVLIT